MARNKYPEETISRILDVSLKLFIENGYEQTSIQEIVDHLGGLTKGAIYHHFKSKEDILLAVSQRMFEGKEKELAELRDHPNLTGLEKLRKLVNTNDPNQEMLFSTSPDLLKNPKLLAIMLQESVEVDAVRYIVPIIEQGMADGSIPTQYPKELAEVIMILSNIWLNPLVFSTTQESLMRRFLFLQDMLEKMGVHLIDDTLVERITQYQKLYEQNKEQK